MTWEYRPSRSGGRPRVLCVDDEPVILTLVQRLLQNQGFEPTGYSDPVAAVAAFESDAFEAVITDIHMPGMDGLELMQSLRERQPEIPVIVVTGHGTVDTAIQALREGCSSSRSPRKSCSARCDGHWAPPRCVTRPSSTDT